MGKRKSASAGAAKLEYIVPDLRPLAVELDSCQLDPANANKHDEQSVKSIASSLAKFGQRTPIVVNALTGYIAKGNGTWLAARRLGWSHIAVVRVKDAPTEHIGYAIADNRTAQLSEWDSVRLAEAIAILESEMPDLSADLLLADLAPAAASPDPPAVDVPELYAVQVECRNEAEQKLLYDRLTKEGRTCKVLTI